MFSDQWRYRDSCWARVLLVQIHKFAKESVTLVHMGHMGETEQLLEYI